MSPYDITIFNIWVITSIPLFPSPPFNSCTFSQILYIMTTTEYYAEYSNKTAYGIKSDAIRYTWAGYYLFVIASSLIGDTTILIASIKYKAFNLHRVSVVVIQHIAVCDLIVSATDILPEMVSVISEKWVLGNFFCYLLSYARYYSNMTSVLLICAMTTSKLLLLKHPLKFGTTTSKKAHLICVACWLVALIPPMTLLLVDEDLDGVIFSYNSYKCWLHNGNSRIWHYLGPFMAVLFAFIPTCLIVSTTLCLLIEARKIVSRSRFLHAVIACTPAEKELQRGSRNRESLKWQGIVTTVLTATVFSLSSVPYTAYLVGSSIVSVDDKSKSSFYTTFFKVALSLTCLNIISNFYIYSLTLTSFRAFIRSKMQLSCQCITNMETSHGNLN